MIDCLLSAGGKPPVTIGYAIILATTASILLVGLTLAGGWHWRMYRLVRWAWRGLTARYHKGGSHD
jgi:hypothetical protein